VRYVLAAALVAIAACSAVAAVDCADLRYERVFGVGHPTKAINVAIVGDLFTVGGTDQLQEYRCAVRLITSGLQTSDPFDNLGCHLNVWRVDSISSTDTVAIGAGSSCVDSAPTFTTTVCSGDPGYDAADPVPTYDFGSTIDAEADGMCQLLVPDSAGLSDLEDIADCLEAEVGEIHTIVLLVDSGAEAGSAIAGDREIAVFTLDDIDVSGSRYARLAHEIGHTFGLLDEYELESFESDALWHAGRNVYWKGQDLDSDGVADDTPADAFWVDVCDTVPSGTNFQTESSGLVPSPCGFVACKSPGDCAEVCGEASSTVSIGFREGGFYESCEYFRAQEQCRMAEGVVDDFCAACTCYMRAVAQDAGYLECFEPSTCGAATGSTYRIVVRDCTDDDGTEPSPCSSTEDSPDIVLNPPEIVSSRPDGGSIPITFASKLELTACATNVGSVPIPADERLYAQFFIANSPDYQSIVDGDTPPTVAEGLLTVADMHDRFGATAMTGDWAVGEERCLTLPIESQFTEEITGPLGLFVTIWLEGHAPNMSVPVGDDNNRAVKMF